MKLYQQDSYFTTEEFACSCGCGFGSAESDIDPLLIEKLNIIRGLYGKSMAVTSGARCAEYNAKIGGAPNSAHTPHHHTGQCRGADIHITNSEARYHLIELSLRIGFMRIGIASTFIHLDVATDLPAPRIFTY